MTLKQRLTQPGNAFLAVSIVLQVANLAFVDTTTHVEAAVRVTLGAASLILLMIGVFIRWNRVIAPRR
jgi:hypothetical protein